MALLFTCFTGHHARVYTRRHLRLRTHELGMRTRTRALVYCLLLEQQPHTAGGPGPLLCRHATTFVAVRQPRSLPSRSASEPRGLTHAPTRKIIVRGQSRGFRSDPRLGMRPSVRRPHAHAIAPHPFLARTRNGNPRVPLGNGYPFSVPLLG